MLGVANLMRSFVGRPLISRTCRRCFADCQLFAFQKFDQPLHFMSGMFFGCSAFNQPIYLNSFHVMDTSHMFFGCAEFNQLVAFDTAKVTNMCSMFAGCAKFNQNITFNTVMVTDMSGMFDIQSANVLKHFYTVGYV